MSPQLNKDTVIIIIRECVNTHTQLYIVIQRTSLWKMTVVFLPFQSCISSVQIQTSEESQMHGIDPQASVYKPHLPINKIINNCIV